MKGKVGVIKPPRHLSPNIGKHMIIFVTILITTTGSKNCYISDAQNVITPAPPTCPGDSAVFTCAVSDLLNNQSTTWRIRSSTCELDHATPNASATCGPSDAFTAQLLSPPENNLAPPENYRLYGMSVQTYYVI